MGPTNAQEKIIPVKDQTFDPVASPKNHATASDEKDFGVRSIEDNLAKESEDPATQIPSRPLDR